MFCYTLDGKYGSRIIKTEVDSIPAWAAGSEGEVTRDAEGTLVLYTKIDNNGTAKCKFYWYIRWWAEAFIDKGRVYEED